MNPKWPFTLNFSFQKNSKDIESRGPRLTYGKVDIGNGVWVSAAHLLGTNKVAADRASRVLCEWGPDETTFESITAYFFRSQIDLFASRLNHQLPRYAAWQPDPGAEAVDAFTLD